MKICFWHSDKPRERVLADAFQRGAKRAGDEVTLRRLEPEITIADCDVAVMVGVKSAERWAAHWKAGINTVMIDKGYCRGKSTSPVRGWEYWRLAVNGHHPTRYLMDRRRPPDRLNRLSLSLRPWREDGDHILIAGSSAKYHAFYGMRDPTAYAQNAIINPLRELTDRAIVYRPKPSWRDAQPIEGTRWSGPERHIADELSGAHCMITHGSNAAFEALLHGVPAIILGDAVTKPISSTRLEDVEAPLTADDGDRRQLLANLAYCQFTLAEFASGLAWRETRPLIYG